MQFIIAKKFYVGMCQTYALLDTVFVNQTNVLSFQRSYFDIKEFGNGSLGYFFLFHSSFFYSTRLKHVTGESGDRALYAFAELH